MEKWIDVSLNTTDVAHNFVIFEESWPNPCCSVMVNSYELFKLSLSFFGCKPEDGHLEIYADIDPERRLVTNFQLIFKANDGKEQNLNIAVTSAVNQVSYYKTFEEEGGKDFIDFIERSLNRLNGIKMEHIGGLIDVFDDFLEEKGVRIPSSDEAMKSDGYTTEDNAARIYGSDYDTLSEKLSYYLRISKSRVLKNRSDALLNYYETSNNELDYYTELAEFASLDMVTEWYGKETADHIKDFWKEHGIEFHE